ncbi:Hsp70 family protein [Corallococcus sp. NCRR]|uniref:Hsp70 family protein n=1 Tax=Corallococcus sp. NCRR TaxID=2996782 RepID=UPI0022A98110|nr:Hsp70 family protein [Corallococcus sp. NCRR]WAS88395.1 Hsp70 family protein [Corallococcus sp. NCRR]
MKCLELLSRQPHIPSRLAVRKVGLSLEFSLLSQDTPAEGALVGNFKPRLIEPDEEFWISLPRADGKFEQVPLTGRQCCEAFMMEISKLLKKGGRKIGQDTMLRFSEPPFPKAEERKAYQDSVRAAAKEAGLGSAISFFREPDAVFEYFRLLQQKIPPQGNSLNVLVLDFGGGTCNVSVVSTTRQGGLWKRYIAAPVAAEASKAGGLYIDQQLLTQALLGAGLKHLYATASHTEERKAYEAWVERHSSEAEALKRRVSETGEKHKLKIKLDGKLADLAGGTQELVIELDENRLKAIVDKHWSERGIRDAMDRVLTKLRTKLSKTAKRKDISEEHDPRTLITHVLIAGGSSRLPGFIDHVKQYFAPSHPEFIRVGKDYPYVVAVGTGLNHLALNRALVDNRATAQPPPQGTAELTDSEPLRSTDSTFIGAFQDDLCLSWHPNHGDMEPQLLVDSQTSPLELLEKPITRDIKLPVNGGKGFRHVRDHRHGYQVAFRNDPEARGSLSGQRLNVTDHSLQFPTDAKKKSAHMQIHMQGDPGHSLEMILQVFSPQDGKYTSERRIPFLSKDAPPKAATPPHPQGPTQAAKGTSRPESRMSAPQGMLSTKALDVLCIDFGTTNTTLIDLVEASDITQEQFMDRVLPSHRHNSRWRDWTRTPRTFPSSLRTLKSRAPTHHRRSPLRPLNRRKQPLRPHLPKACSRTSPRLQAHRTGLRSISIPHPY